MNIAYRNDFYGWTQEQAALLKAGRLDRLDIEHLIEELESMGARERRELGNRLAVLLMHLLKWQFQPERRGRSWSLTIKIQRLDIRALLKQNPGIGPDIPEILADAYAKARLLAARQTGLDEAAFPEQCGWPIESVLSDEFLP